MLHMRYQKWQYFIRGVEKITKCNNCIGFIENEEMQNVKKTIGESMISWTATVVVVKALSRGNAVCERQTKNKKM